MRIKQSIAICFAIALFFLTAATLASTMSNNETFVENKTFTDLNKTSFFSINEKLTINDAQKKLSTDLLQLIDARFLPPGQNQEDLKEQMEQLHQLIRAEDAPPQTFSDELEESDLVYVYVYLYPSFNTHSIDPYVNEVTNRDEKYHLAVAWVKVDALESLASLEQVRTIHPVMPPVTRIGSYTTEGDSILNCDEVRNFYGVTGAGIKVGIISNGVDHLSTAQATGDLPTDVHVLRNNIGEDEGTAMLEIVHDIAPSSELYFHDCGKNILEFNYAIDSLVNAGCTVICDDIAWISEPFFEDGIVASHVQEVIENHDILYVSSTGNSAESHYQGFYYNDVDHLGWHDFSSGTNDSKDLYVDIPPGGTVKVILQWNDQFGYSTNDYNLYLIDYNTGEILSQSENWQNGNDNPLEFIVYTNFDTDYKNAAISVTKYSGEPKLLEVYIYPKSGVYVYTDNIVAEDSIFGHPAIPYVVSVGAIAAYDENLDDIQSYSSRGPVSIYYPSYELREKTDICGIDGVSVTGAGGFPSPFYGTSASATHIAAIAAQLRSEEPTKTADGIREALYNSAIDLGSDEYDYVYGHGRADALEAYEYLTKQHLTRPPAVRTLPALFVDPGEQFTVSVEVSDYGLAGQLIETIPPGFTFDGSAHFFKQNGQVITFPLFEDDVIEYTVIAAETEGIYQFVGTMDDFNKVKYLVEGDDSIKVGFHPLIYDYNSDGLIEKNEVFEAIKDYFNDKITKDNVIEVIVEYFNS